MSQEDIMARDYFRACAEELDLRVQVDDLGCMYATLDGLETTKPIIMGSHLDSVERGGRFDGVLGVIAGVEVIRTLVDHGIQPRRPVTVMNFTNEEGARFEPAMMTSGILAGKFSKDEMFQKRDRAGVTFGEALAASGYQGDAENRVKEATAYLELHIEQGPVLERERLSIGVVDCVVGMTCYEFVVTGASNHAGTTPMNMRRDAFFTAVEVVQQLRQEFDALGDRDLVYTMGRVNVYPNIHTVIPNRVVFTVEARHKHAHVIQAVERIMEGVTGRRGGCDVTAAKVWGRDTVWFDPQICQHVEEAVQGLGYSYQRMVSGAGHDAQFVASFLPSAMIFVPSVGGRSHCEDELTSYEDCEKGVNVLLRTVLSLLESR
ncbi:N-carbamoyl-L-amino-acid hydrolase [Alicyclobacillus cycloheptanicus]|uniref:N-carbamoyl-L-amino-acid hydrolase n=1 Tax=Alicyclobacillus cycloheptanicus TaxID=1457 RepID=A0ABT9XH50_9BACL|nr:N-carbamoyl-L-amino-acid hydrolase [Alicyclobacillus cycloheptanicus]